MQENSTPRSIRREHYTPSPFLIDRVFLAICLRPQATEVSSTLSLRRNPAASPTPLSSVVLDGVDLELVTIELDGSVLPAERYSLNDEHLEIHALPEQCELRIVNRIDPENNKSLEGLYLSSGNYCTQCEAQGFRKITWFLDRPDVLSRYQVRVEADRKLCPVLLSNGNCIDQGELDDGRHFALWDDPHPKPSYLFAMVAGDLQVLEDQFTTVSGRVVALKIYVEAHNLDKCDYAMQALKASMAWDETVYGLEYDLDIFMIVAVDDFNMGAMENKGLNIFNSKYVLADQETATDTDFMGVEAVIAHEYFHNWTGNRVTCRDWFQLSLKEGLTVFRDQQFSADQNSPAVKRIEDVRLLRLRQFPEDAGPMAHPIRPDDYIEINNFYTLTVYEKGAEVIRMLHTLLGAERFRAGIDLYFERFDGMAVTCDDFVQAMHDAGGVDLTQFRRWYEQAGTPVLNIESHYDAAAQEYSLTVRQSCPPTPGQSEKPPLHIPLLVALFGADGSAVPLRLESDTAVSEVHNNAEASEKLLHITDQEHTFVFQKVDAAPIPSVLRNFSAPVTVNLDYQEDELAFLMANDTDAFNRWDAGQRLYCRAIEALAGDPALTPADSRFKALMTSFGQLVSGQHADPALLAEALSIPGIEAVSEHHKVIHIDALHSAIESLKTALVREHREALLDLATTSEVNPDGFQVNSAAIAGRRLRNVCLALLGTLPNDQWLPLVMSRYFEADNMTDRIAALQILCDSDATERKDALDDFYQRWQNERLVIDKWFALQATSTRADTVDAVQQLTKHPAFELTNPNRARSVLGVFASSNTLRFHSRDGRGYQLVADYVLKLDQFNPQVAARLAVPLGRWQRFDADRAALMQRELCRLHEHPALSADVFEIVSRSLSPANVH